MIPFRALLASFTSPTPRPTSCEEAEIRLLISLAAPAERCASARTSEATTAKPRPLSPARAASTPAFSASKLVWKAISSMTPMMSAMLRELSSMPLMAATAACMTSRERSPARRAEAAATDASRALSALCDTVAVT